MGGLTAPQNVNVPPFISAGGVTPEEQALAQYTQGQGLLANASQYGGEGLGQSTMETQGAEGVNRAEAQLLGQASDVNQGAFYNLYQNDVAALEQQLKNQTTLSQPTLTALAGGLNQLLFPSGGGGGGTGTG